MPPNLPPTEPDSHRRRELAEIISLKPKRGVAELVMRLKKYNRRVVDAASNAGWATLIQAVCAQGPGWDSQLRQRAQGKMRCPPYIRKLISQALADFDSSRPGEAKLTPENVLRRARIARSSGTLVLADPEELGLGRRRPSLFARLHQLGAIDRTPVDLCIRFECPHVYVHELAILATWVARFAASVTIDANRDRVRRYLDSTGFRATVQESQTIGAVRYDQQNHVALTSVHREEQAYADSVARRIVDLFERHASLPSDQAEPLRIMFAELVENIYRHAESDYPAYVMAQAYPTKQKLHVAVVDCGIGIYDSFRRVPGASKDQGPRNELQAIEMALEKFVTSKQEQHSGYGLFVVRRLVERNGGHFWLTSGRTSVHISPSARKNRPPNRDYLAHRLWPGTEVSSIFELSRPLPLTDVYRELGPIDDE